MIFGPYGRWEEKKMARYTVRYYQPCGKIEVATDNVHNIVIRGTGNGRWFDLGQETESRAIARNWARKIKKLGFRCILFRCEESIEHFD